MAWFRFHNKAEGRKWASLQGKPRAVWQDADPDLPQPAAPAAGVGRACNAAPAGEKAAPHACFMLSSTCSSYVSGYLHCCEVVTIMGPLVVNDFIGCALLLWRRRIRSRGACGAVHLAQPEPAGRRRATGALHGQCHA